MIKTIQFLRSFNAYQPGMIAGLLVADADRLIAAGVAKAYVKPDPIPEKHGLVSKMITKRKASKPKA